VSVLEHGQHWPVLLVPQPWMQLDEVVRRDADQILVEGTVVDRAQAESVGDGGLAARIGVPDDVGCVEEPGLLRPGVSVTRRVSGSSEVTKTGHSGRYQPGRVPTK